MVSNKAWNKIFKDYKLGDHDFDEKPYILSAGQIKASCINFKNTGEKEPRILFT